MWTSGSSTSTTTSRTAGSAGGSCSTGLAQIGGGAAAATALLTALQNDYALAAVVAENDPRLATETAGYDVAGARVSDPRAPQAAARSAPRCW